MITRSKTPQLNLLPILNLLRIAVAPLQRHVRVRIRVYENIECAVTVELRKKGHRGGDLPEDCLDFFLNLFLGLFWLCFGASVDSLVEFLSGMQLWTHTRARRSPCLLISLMISTLRTC
jgi:hypothetical protein